MLKLKKLEDDEYLQGDVEILSSSGNVIRAIWLKESKNSIFLDVTYEYACDGRYLSGIYLDDHFNVLGTHEYIYDKNNKHLVSRIERDHSGNELYRYDYISDIGNKVNKVELYSRGQLVEYGLLTYLLDEATEPDDIITHWFDINGKPSENPYPIERVWNIAQKFYNNRVE